MEIVDVPTTAGGIAGLILTVVLLAVVSLVLAFGNPPPDRDPYDDQWFGGKT